MKKLLMSVALLALAVPAAAVVDPGPNGIGVFFDSYGDHNCSPYPPAVYTPLTAYLLVTNPGASGKIAGWEGQLLINPPTFAAGITLDIGPEALNVFTAPAFNVGFTSVGVRQGNPITLVTFTTFYLGGPISFGVGPTEPSSTHGACPCFVDAVDNALLVLLRPTCDRPWPFTPAQTYGGAVPYPDSAYLSATVGGCMVDCVVATEPSSWGSVKALYK